MRVLWKSGNMVSGNGLMKCPNPDCPDIELFGVQGRYRAGFTECPKCGAGLVDEAPPFSQPAIADESGSESVSIPDLASGHDSDRLAAVAAFNYRNEGDVVATLLWARGFPAVVNSDDCGHMNPALSVANEVFVSVRASDVDDVVDLLDSVLDGPDAPEPTPRQSLDYLRFYRSSRALIACGVFFFPAIFMAFALVVALLGVRRLPSRDDEQYGMASRRMLILVVSTMFFTIVSAFGLIWTLLIAGQ